MSKHKSIKQKQDEKVENYSKEECRAEIAWLERGSNDVQYYNKLRERLCYP